jgi:hypothetical protein
MFHLPIELQHLIISFIYDDIDHRRTVHLSPTIIIIHSLLEKVVRTPFMNLHNEYYRYNVPNLVDIPERKEKNVIQDTLVYRVKDFACYGQDFLLSEFAMYRLKHKTGTHSQEEKNNIYKADLHHLFWEKTRYVYKLYPKPI